MGRVVFTSPFMSSVSPKPSPFVCRTFLVAMTLLGVVAAGELGVLAGRGFSQKPQTAMAVAATPAPQPPASTPAVGTVEEQLVASAVEKSLVAALPRPTPVPTATPPPARPVTPESQVAGLIDLARALRDRGDTGTAMTRLRQAQAIFGSYAPVSSEMALTYEKMGLMDKALEQWRRIYEMGEKAGIYYAAAEAKLRALQLPDPSPEETAGRPATAGALTPDATAESGPVLSLGNVGTPDDTGTTQPARRLKLRVPILARPGSQVQPRDVVIQVFFYEQLKDGSLVETNASVTSSWARRMSPQGEVLPVDWSTSDPEVLEVDYAQPEFDPKDPRTRERRNYFGYSVRLYYKGTLNAKLADPVRLLNQFIPPAALPSTDLPQ